jgi:hypothetical protein
MQKVRWLDKLIDELAKGKEMDKILRSWGECKCGNVRIAAVSLILLYSTASAQNRRKLSTTISQLNLRISSHVCERHTM